MKSTKKVLIFEDEKALGQVLAQKLELEGYTTKLQTNGANALACIQEVQPDLVILDLVMPKLDGFTVLEQVKGDAELKNIPMIILSNLSQEQDMQQVKELGANEFLVKSNTPLAEVVKKVSSYLS